MSGGKDSCALAFAAAAHLDRVGHQGQRLLIHSDLGVVEWKDSLPTCERLAKAVGWELAVVRRQAGGMLERWRQRWVNCKQRYAALECVKLILPWSTPAMRFCTAELKRDVICSELKKRWPGRTIVSGSGIRAEESSKRKNAPVTKTQPKLTTKKTAGFDWHPILTWTLGDVLACLREKDFPLHEAYTKYGMTRVSCAYCIMSSAADLRAATTCADNVPLYRRMVELEIASTFAFQGDKWLGDVAPQLLEGDAYLRLGIAKYAADARRELEAKIPPHLLYEKGWPTVMPTREEATLLADVRRKVAGLLNLGIEYTNGSAVLQRYQELMDKKPKKEPAHGEED